MREDGDRGIHFLESAPAGYGMLCQKQGKFIKMKIMMGKQEESQSRQLEQEMGSHAR